MILLRATDLGPLAFARAVREGALVPVADGAARPPDVPDSPGLRALAAAPRVPGWSVLSGSAALWVHGWRDRPPPTWHAVGPRGQQRPRRCLVALHSGVTAAVPDRIGPLRVAPPARACVDALRWEPPRPALAAVLAALRDGRLTADELRAAFASDSRLGDGYPRLASLVDAVTAASRP
ncbi:hypothetical protein [Demequina iriomotensis]|uniref:hypothetical protein n=1 Tax=Demequina iriomotensis TaxID=1536641 RepID=UPI0012E0B836|nr:hypothetical protein [Demequina iriomotensis]